MMDKSSILGQDVFFLKSSIGVKVYLLNSPRLVHGVALLARADNQKFLVNISRHVSEETYNDIKARVLRYPSSLTPLEDAVGKLELLDMMDDKSVGAAGRSTGYSLKWEQLLVPAAVLCFTAASLMIFKAKGSPLIGSPLIGKLFNIEKVELKTDIHRVFGCRLFGCRLFGCRR